MKLYDVYKKSIAGENVFVERRAASGKAMARLNLPPLAEGEEYLSPREVMDRGAYKRAIAAFKAIARQEPDPYTGFIAHETADKLKRTLDKLEEEGKLQ